MASLPMIQCPFAKSKVLLTDITDIVEFVRSHHSCLSLCTPTRAHNTHIPHTHTHKHTQPNTYKRTQTYAAKHTRARARAITQIRAHARTYKQTHECTINTNRHMNAQ